MCKYINDAVKIFNDVRNHFILFIESILNGVRFGKTQAYYMQKLKLISLICASLILQDEPCIEYFLHIQCNVA